MKNTFFTCRFFFGVVALFWVLSFSAVGAVREVPANDIQRVVKSEAFSVVLFTSPDIGCGYCRGQAQLLDSFARNYEGPAKLLRVQWSPWQNFPSAEKLPKKTYALPMWVAVRSGKEVLRSEGRLNDLAAVHAFFERDVVSDSDVEVAPKL